MDPKPKSNRLKEFRERIRLSLTEVAKVTDLSPSTISMHENGERFPDRVSLSRYSKLYKVPTHVFFFDDGEDTEIQPIS